MNVIVFILTCLIFYLIGSFPTAYILVRSKYNKDITVLGSGNVGALNTAEVTGSKLNGFLVLIIDLIKGVIPVLYLLIFTYYKDFYFILPLLFLLVGHNYSVWIGFKGGRGLATAAGMLLVINFYIVITWAVIWFISILIKKDIPLANVVASLLFNLPIIFFIDFYNKIAPIVIENVLYLFVLLISLLVILKYKDLILRKRFTKKIIQ